MTPQERSLTLRALNFYHRALRKSDDIDALLEVEALIGRLENE